MKWYWFVLIYVLTFLTGMGTGWLLTRKKVVDAANDGGVVSDPGSSAGVQSVIERAKQKLHDLFHRR